MARTDKQARDDAVMQNIAEEMLRDPELQPIPEMRRAMLQRLLELLEQEAKRRPAHRPASSVGSFVGNLIDAFQRSGKSAADAKRRAVAIVAKARRLKPESVERAYRRHRQERGQK